MNGRGQTILLSYGSREKWWISKNIWALGQIAIMYLSMIVGILVFSVFSGVNNRGFSKAVSNNLSGADIYNTSNLLFLVILLPVLYSIFATIVQINMSLILNPVTALIMVVAYDVASSYMQSPFFLGNFSMAYRTASMIKGGLSPVIGIVSELVLIIIAFVSGIIFFNKKDIL